MALNEEFKSQGDFLFRYRSYLPLIILVIGLGVFILGQFRSEEIPENRWEGIYEYICLALSLLGLWIRIITVGHTPRNTSGRNTKAGQVAEELNTSGIYSRVRHPLYLGNFFMWLGVAMLTANAWFIVAFIFFYALYYERIMYAEEHFLHHKFGEQYAQWAARTPAIIPSLKKHTRATYPFSIKKVLKKEKNGLAAVFILFWIFDFAGHWIRSGTPGLVLNFWFFGAATATLLYLILKILKRRKVFNEPDR